MISSIDSTKGHMLNWCYNDSVHFVFDCEEQVVESIVAVGVIIALFGYLESIRRDLRNEIKEVRQASDTAHTDIRNQLCDLIG